MSPAASFQPETIDLSASFVQLIRTSLTNPKVTLDKSGLQATDPTGHVIFDLDAVLGNLTLTGDLVASSIIDDATNGQIFNLTPAGALTLKGIINALGVTLPTQTQTSDPAVQSRVRWTDVNGVKYADIIGQGITGGANVQGGVQVNAYGPTDNVSASLTAQSQSASPLASVLVQQKGSGANQTAVIASAKDSGHIQQNRSVIDSLGNSDFLQLGGGSDSPIGSRQRIAWKTLQFASTGSTSVTLTLPHGLGYTPSLSFGWAVGWFGFFSETSGPDATNLHLQCNTAPTTGSPFMRWVALGG